MLSFADDGRMENTSTNVVETCHQWSCPLRVRGVELGHKEVVQRGVTVDGSGDVKWSKSWEIVARHSDGHDHYGYMETITLRLVEHPGYLWTQVNGSERVEIFVPPENVASVAATLRAANHTVLE